MDGWMNEKILFGKKAGKKCSKCLGELTRITEIPPVSVNTWSTPTTARGILHDGNFCLSGGKVLGTKYCIRKINMAARTAFRTGTCMYSALSKSVLNRGSGYMQRCLISSSSYTSAFGTSRRFAVILAACSGVSLSAVVSYHTLFSTAVKARPITDSQIDSQSVTRKGISELTVTLYQYQNCPFLR